MHTSGRRRGGRCCSCSGRRAAAIHARVLLRHARRFPGGEVGPLDNPVSARLGPPQKSPGMGDWDGAPNPAKPVRTTPPTCGTPRPGEPAGGRPRVQKAAQWPELGCPPATSAPDKGCPNERGRRGHDCRARTSASAAADMATLPLLQRSWAAQNRWAPDSLARFRAFCCCESLRGLGPNPRTHEPIMTELAHDGSPTRKLKHATRQPRQRRAPARAPTAVPPPGAAGCSASKQADNECDELMHAQIQT